MPRPATGRTTEVIRLPIDLKRRLQNHKATYGDYSSLVIVNRESFDRLYECYERFGGQESLPTRGEFEASLAAAERFKSERDAYADELELVRGNYQKVVLHSEALQRENVVLKQAAEKKRGFFGL